MMFTLATILVLLSGSPRTTGSCCLDFICYPSEQAECIAIPGAFFSFEPTCQTAFCPLPALGACCLARSCVETTMHDCIVNLGGIYHGNNTYCVDDNNNSIADICENPCYADIAPTFKPDGEVNVSDLLTVISHWGDGNGHGAWEWAGDLAPIPNGDGLVNVTDLLAVISAWGPCP